MSETEVVEERKILKSILSKWKFPVSISKKYEEKGIVEIFDWQAECLNNVQVSDAKQNLIYSAPTSAGKSLVAELFMLKNVLDWRRKAIMIFPYVSLAKEKLAHLQMIASESFLRIDGFIGGSSPSGGFAAVDIAVCTIEKANSLLNRLIEDESIFELGAIVIDELHMINDSSRGYLLELILSKIKYLCKKNKNDLKIQIIGMSATLPNLRVLSDWLDAILYETDFRPVSLIECLKYETNVYDRNQSVVSHINVDPRIDNDPDHLAHLVLETIVNKLGVLVFCPTKSRCETIAEHIARSIYNLEKHHGETISYLNKDKLVECLNELKNTPAGLDPQLAKTVRYGIAFHHAGLTMEEREILEHHFKRGDLLVIVCTSTLSSGINFPARRVIIRTPIFNGRPVDPMSYKQMAGRAGRKGIDTCGESILMCANANEKKIAQMLISSSSSKIPEAAIGGNLGGQTSNDLNSGVKRALLETIVSGVACSKQEVIDYVSCFLSTRLENADAYEKYLKWLNQNQFIDVDQSVSCADEINRENYKPTQLGFAVVGAAMSPDEGLVIFGELQKAMQCFVLENELHIVYQITPINICDYWMSSSSTVDWNLFYTIHQTFTADVRRVSDLVGVRQSFLLKMLKGTTSMQTCDQKLLRIHLRFYTALILNDLVNEIPFASILVKYNCQKGFLQTLQQSASTYSAMITVFCNRLGWFNLEMLVNQFQSRLTFGVQRQLVDLVRIKLLNSHRARLFYNAGFTTVASIAMCDAKKCEKILRSGLTFVSTKAVGDKQQAQVKNADEANNSDALIWYDGVGYTYWQAASMILKEANELLRSDLEQIGVKISTAATRVGDEKDANKTNKSIFKFDDTVESMLVNESTHNSSSRTQSDFRKSLITDPHKETTMVEAIEEEKFPLAEVVQIESSISRGIKALKIQDNKQEEEQQEQKQANTDQDEDSSFIDDNIMLQAVKTYENIRNSATKQTKQQSPCVSRAEMNTTMVSQDVLNACDFLEKKVISNKKQPTKVSDSNNQVESVTTATKTTTRKSLNFSFGERTLKNILNSPTSTQMTNEDLIDKEELKKIFATQDRTIATVNVPIANNQLSSPFKHEISEYFRVLNLTSLNLNIIDDLASLQTFSSTIKQKTSLSISLVIQRLANKENESTELKSVESANQWCHLEFYDEQLDCYLRLVGLFVYLESEKLDRINLVLINSDKVYLSRVREMIEKDEVTKILFFAQKHARSLYKSINATLKSPCYDPIIASWLLNQEQLTIFQIAQKYASNLKLPVDAVFKTSKSCFGCMTGGRVETDMFTALKGGLIECLMAMSCFDKLKLQLQLENVWIYFAKVESEVVLLSARIELAGLGLDSEELERLKILLMDKKREIEEKVMVYAGSGGKQTLNLNSPDEIAYVLFNRLKLKPPGTDEKNMFAGHGGEKVKHHRTSKEVLLQLASQHEFPKLVILWRKVNYALSNSIYPVERNKIYVRNWKMYRVHPSVDLQTVTGRMNFFNPCLQNIPRDFEIETVENILDDNCLQLEAGSANALQVSSELNEDFFLTTNFLDKISDNPESKSSSNKASQVSLRNIFVSAEGNILLAADYSQLELRIITNLCRDETLISIFNDTRHDVFNLLASKWLNLPIEQIDDVKRQNVKKVIYGIIYGISAKTLGVFLSLNENEASTFIESFKCTFPGLKNYINKQIETCRVKGYVETIRKRRRYLPNISTLDIRQRAQAERQAVNTIVQGSASDLVKSAMIKIEKTLRKRYANKDQRRGAFMVMQLHDELIYEVNKRDLTEVQAIVRDCMENCMELPVRMKIKMKCGTTWGSLTPV